MDKPTKDVCDTGLALGLGHKLSSSSTTGDRQGKDPSKPRETPLEPLLTLGLSGEINGLAMTKAEAGLARQSSTHSTISSFSNATVKRERDLGGDEAETEKVSPALSVLGTEEEEEGGVRKKLRLTKEQAALLEDKFKEHSTLNPKQKQSLAKELDLRPRQVEVWFQNRRARTKLKQTEVDCELLKKCCEKLAEENRRLQKELQDLKAMKFASPPVYMQIPIAAATMCPKCERVARGEDGGAKGGSFLVARSKPLLFNPFTNSAAC